MTLTIPTLSETRGFSRDDVVEALRVDALPGNAPAAILADANAGLGFLALQYLQRTGVEFLPDLAGVQMLQRWSDIKLPGGRKAATYSVLAATLSGPSGTVVPQATQFSAGGILFQSLADVTLGGTGVATPIAVRALTAGAIGNLAVGAVVSLVAAIPVAGGSVTSSATVTGITTPGVDVESVTAWRNRVLFELKRPPMGGDADDYERWTLQVPGVTRVWVSPNAMGPGSVTLRFMMDDLRGGIGQGLPTDEDIARVKSYLDSVRPVTVRDLFVFAPTLYPLTVQISNLSRNNASTQAAIIASIQAMLMQRAAPSRAVNGSRVPAQTIYAAWMYEAISAAEGVDYFDLDFPDTPMPDGSCMAVLGSGSVIFG